MQAKDRGWSVGGRGAMRGRELGQGCGPGSRGGGKSGGEGSRAKAWKEAGAKVSGEADWSGKGGTVSYGSKPDARRRQPERAMVVAPGPWRGPVRLS